MTDEEFELMRERIREVFEDTRERIDDSMEEIGQEPIFRDSDE